LTEIERSPETLDGILVTHEHTDHIQGLTGLCAKLKIPLYCNRLTKEALESSVKTPLDYRIFSTGATVELEDLAVETFSVPHDAYDPVGFLLRTGAGNIGWLTDLGHATRLAVERCLLIISEAARKLGPEAEARCPEIPWSRVRGLGNWLRHDYDRMNYQAIWETVTQDLAVLRTACHRQLKP
jgi:hypothetical protein